ncbi:MAG: Ig-like domain-containing protein, partial [Planctomycetota bacterium]
MIESAIAPDYLEPQSDPFNLVADANNTRDPFLDHTVLATGTYYVAVSGSGNDSFDPEAISGRSGGNGGTGDYDISIQNYAPRSFVISLDNEDGPINQTRDTMGSRADALIGTTFAITTIADVPGSEPQGDGTNIVTFEFTDNQGGLFRPNGNVNVPLLTGTAYVVPDIIRAISNAINGLVNDPTLPNHEFQNGPDGRSGPLTRGRSQALGGRDGDNLGIANLSRNNFIGHYLLPSRTDFTFGFGHDRHPIEVGSIGIATTLTDGAGTTELYAFVENVAEITISPEATAAGLRLDPEPGRDTDQLISEAGVMIAGGASPTLVNNVFVNLHESVVVEETDFRGFGRRNRDEAINPKPQDVVIAGSIFQYDETNQTRFQSNKDFAGTVPALRGTGLTTDEGPSNLNGGNDDFNQTLGNNDVSLQFPGGDNFLPALTSVLVDSGINSTVDRDALANVKNSVGIPSSNILSPNRDIRGVLRADNPDAAPIGGVGASAFIDRGSNELADFVGPVAIFEVPRDNDPSGADVDPALTIIRTTEGVIEEFRIQLRDDSDASDPFPGLGVDDSSVIVPEIPGLRPSGATFTLFENDRLLTEGIDYTFSYDANKNLVSLRPLAGIWQDSRSYRVALNNVDRTVLLAPSPSEINDGDQVSITDSNGGTVVLEFEFGYQLLAPEALTLIVPEVGTNAGGLSDGDLFQINDGVNSPVTFEFNSDTATLPASVAIDLPTETTPIGAGLDQFLADIAESIRVKIQEQVDAGNLDVSVSVDGARVIVGAEPGATANTQSSGLGQAARTLGLQLPATGVNPGGIVDGDRFIISNGEITTSFEWDTNNSLTSVNSVAVPVDPGMTAEQAAARLVETVQQSLGLNVEIITNAGGGPVVYLNLPSSGSVSVPGGQVRVVGVSRTPLDGGTITISPNDGSTPIVLEVNRTDEPDGSGNTADDGVAQDNVPINITRSTTADAMVALISNALRALPAIPGLPIDSVESVAGGLLSIGGESGLEIDIVDSSLEVTGSPSVTGASTIEVFGSLVMTLPLIGGGGITDGSVLVLKDDNGEDVVFEFNLVGTATEVTESIPVLYNTFDTVDELGTNLVAAINGQNTGITAQVQSTGRISFGRIEADRVSIDGTDEAPGLPQLTVRRDIVSDGEVLTIRQSNVSVSFEFESANNGGGVGTGNVPVAFQPGSSVGDVATNLAAAINNNLGGLRVNAAPVLDANGEPTGQVELNDLPGTIVDTENAPTLNVIGVPGGAVAVSVSPNSTAADVKRKIVLAINQVNDSPGPDVTTLSASDRGGATFFVENGDIFTGPLTNFFLPGIKDVAGNLLEDNQPDGSTQFTLLLPNLNLDFGDAPDPFQGSPGRYPVTALSNGARHVVDRNLTLGTRIDADNNGSPTTNADGDDKLIAVTPVGALFTVTQVGGDVTIGVTPGVDPTLRDGDAVIIDMGTSRATLEFSLDGQIDEDSFAVEPTDPTSPASIAEALLAAIEQSPVRPASSTVVGETLLVSGDDEDGVSFTSEINPSGILNKGVTTPITVSVSGAGILQAWIDFNADGDWDDPNEQIIMGTENDAIFEDTGSVVTRTFNVTVPAVSPDPTGLAQTFARFRVSREGNLSPTGLALSGEVEDHVVKIAPGLPPVVEGAQANRSYVVDEDRILQALDQSGALTQTDSDDGILQGVIDPDGDTVEVFASDVGIRELSTASGEKAGDLNLFDDGTFTFQPVADFNGEVSFTARVTDRQTNPDAELVNSNPITVTITVRPVNDAPTAVSTPVTSNVTINEDDVTVFSVADLIEGRYLPGPDNESSQPLLFGSVSDSSGTPFATDLGGSLSIGNDGTTITYTPPMDYNGSVADTFTFTVVDDPGDPTQLPETAADSGEVSVNFVAVNDGPRTVDKFLNTSEGTPVSINVTGANGLLAGDTPGPQDEIDANQTISLVANQFPKMSREGGVVTLSGGVVTYDPAVGFSGTDEFTYSVVDSEGAVTDGLVTINVGDVNMPPSFVGINGDVNTQSLSFIESKVDPQQFQYDLSTWFNDPESDPLTFEVVSSDPSSVEALINGTTLTLNLPTFKPGDFTLTLSAK